MIDMPRGVGEAHGPGQPPCLSLSGVARGNRPDAVWLKGSTLGGSSSINGMVYVRGHPSDYDGWKAAGGSAGEELKYRNGLPDVFIRPASGRQLAGCKLL